MCIPREGISRSHTHRLTPLEQISVVLNSVSTGMDMAGLAPKYINIKRGSYIMAVIGIATQPWQLLSTADRFLKVLSGFGVFMAPAT
jgi:nucleobase:cation symporter-1, NCS1 family